MKNKLLFLATIALTFIACLILLNTTSYAGSQTMENLTYEVTLNEDGSADVVETWEIYVSSTNTLFKTFDLDEDKYTAITNVTVAEISKTGSVTNFIQTPTYAYHVTKGYYYALNIAYKEFEIAWGVGLDNTSATKTYQISYTITDAVTVYNDCAEFYWMFLSTSNAIPVEHIEGTITLPSSVSNIDNLKVWAHGPLNGEIERTDNQTVTFTVDNLSTKTMLETRVVTTENIYTACTKIENEDKLDEIIEEETEWANEANEEREETLRQQKAEELIILMIVAVFAIAILAVIIVLICKIVKYAKILKNTQKIEAEEKYEYYRDFPDETASPAEAAYLYYFDKLKFKKNVSDIVSAIILDLGLKKLVEFEEKEKDEVEIKILPNKYDTSLTSDEASIYNLLIRVRDYTNSKSKNEPKETISMKDIEKYAKNNDTRFLSEIDGLENDAQIAQTNKGNVDTDNKLITGKWSKKSLNYYVVGILCLCFITFVIPVIWAPFFIICGILCGKIAKKTGTLTQKGANEQEKWRALKRYMENFSLLDQREVPELALWEKYLVYATAFGVADKVLDQLKVRYPELTNESFMIDNGYGYIYFMNTYHFNRVIQTSMNRAYRAGINARNARNAASSGGSWSGGGGRRRRILRRRPVAGGGRRPEWAEDKIGK